MIEERQELLLYIHIPFCQTKCHYCNFNSSVFDPTLEAAYIEALLKELESYCNHPDFCCKTVGSIYLGGGTPSILQPAAIAKVLTQINSCFQVKKGAEITIEANPGTVDLQKLKDFRALNINRLSLGIQSLSARQLRFLGRSHSPEQALFAFIEARQAGFTNISVDLISAMPTQSEDELYQDLTEITNLSPEHISVYTLTIEPDTPLFKVCQESPQLALNEDLVAKFFDLTVNFLSKHAYQHYEISNFCKTHFPSQHNLGYWSGVDYLGIGAGAHSYHGLYQGRKLLGASRWANQPNPPRYIEQIKKENQAKEWQEQLTDSQAIFETIFLGLRLKSGIDSKVLREKGDATKITRIFKRLEELSQSGLVNIGEKISLTERGLRLADSISVELLSALDGKKQM